MSEQTNHEIDDHEKELIFLAVKQLRDRCNQTLNWLHPPPPTPTEDSNDG